MRFLQGMGCDPISPTSSLVWSWNLALAIRSNDNISVSLYHFVCTFYSINFRSFFLTQIIYTNGWVRLTTLRNKQIALEENFNFLC